ncbi:hypothetical protein V3C99_006238, partial [Haemonchus contortus]
RMFDEAASAVGTSGMSYINYESPTHTTVEELEEAELVLSAEIVTEKEIYKSHIIDVEAVDHMEPYDYMEISKRLSQGENESNYERSSIRKYRMLRRKPAQTFYCRPCNKEIKYPSKIAEHLRKHTGERPYQCQICGAGFSQGHVLKVHLRSHHGELPYKCSYCSDSFPSLAQKKQHEKSHYRQDDKGPAQEEKVLAQESVETDENGEAVHVGQVAVETHIYACPVIECGMQSHNKEEVEEHIAVVHGEMQEWIEAGAETAVYGDGEEAIVMNETDESRSQIVDTEQHPILVAEDQQYEYYPYEETSIIIDDSRVNGVELQEPKYTLESGIHQTLEGSDEKYPAHQLYDHFTYIDDLNVPPPTEEIEVETSEQQQYMLEVGPPSHLPVQQTIIYDSNPENGIGMYDVNLTQDGSGDQRVRVLVDPKPPKKGRLTCDEYYDRAINKNMQEIEVDASVIEMAAPIHHVSMMTEEGPVVIAPAGGGRIRRNRLIQSQSDRPHGARNLDWIIDAVARGLDIDSASPHNRRKPVMHKCQYCGRVDKYPSKIKAHLRTHTGEKPFKCDICGMMFAQRTPMRLHVRRHLDQKPYICTIEGCDLRFVSGALLNYHQQTKHFLTKRYICLKGCGRFFASARNQRNHEARCFYNTEQAHDFGDAIYEQLVYNDQEEEEASDREVNDELEQALESVEHALAVPQESLEKPLAEEKVSLS